MLTLYYHSIQIFKWFQHGISAKNYSLAIVLLFAGCMEQQYEYIISKPPKSWTEMDCFTIIVSSSVNNFKNERSNLALIATPYNSAVVTAISIMDKQKMKLTDVEFEKTLTDRLTEDLGIYLDVNSKSIFDSKGHFFRDETQADSLMIFIDIKNKSWPCAYATINKGGENARVSSSAIGIPFSDYPCYSPDISDLDQRIFLENETGGLLKANSVWGRKQNVLMAEEHLLVVFSLRSADGNFLTNSNKMFLNLKGLEGDIRLEVPMFKSVVRKVEM